MNPVIVPGSHVTLHYRLILTDQGQEVISTFGGKPATISPGYGQLAEALERSLLGLQEGETRSFLFDQGQAYGNRNPDLIQTISRQTLASNTEETEFEVGDLVDFPGPDGDRFAGVLKEIDEQRAVFDFNHPLAGRPIQFDVQIIGVL